MNAVYKHTPGPWRTESRDVEEGCLWDFDIQRADGLTFATALYNGSTEETEANARLIAAAPDLLVALLACERLILRAIPEFNWGKSPLSAVSIRVLNETPAIVRAAIAKATGTGGPS